MGFKQIAFDSAQIVRVICVQFCLFGALTKLLELLLGGGFEPRDLLLEGVELGMFLAEVLQDDLLSGRHDTL